MSHITVDKPVSMRLQKWITKWTKRAVASKRNRHSTVPHDEKGRGVMKEFNALWSHSHMLWWWL